MENKELVKLAKQAQEKSYSPYSHYSVGCAIELSDGTVLKGCNVENVAFGPSNCAERTAIFKGVSEGRKDFVKFAIIGDGTSVCYPCGVCRQVIMEFAPNAIVICAKNEDEFEEHTISELLPYAFSPESLK